LNIPVAAVVKKLIVTDAKILRPSEMPGGSKFKEKIKEYSEKYEAGVIFALDNKLT